MTSYSFFEKEASFVAYTSLLLASINLVLQLGIVISLFLGWHLVAGEYGVGILFLGKALKFSLL